MKSLSFIFAVLFCAGCDLFGGKSKVPLEGKRIPLSEETTLSVSKGASISTPLADAPRCQENDQWLQSGHSPCHVASPFAVHSPLVKTAEESISGGYQATIHPIVVKRIIYVLTNEGILKAINFSGATCWELPLVCAQSDKEAPCKHGGGLASDGQILFVTTSWGELIAVDSVSRKIIWRRSLSMPARSGPLIFKGHVLALTLKNKLEVFEAKTGAPLWQHAGLMEEATLEGGSVPAALEDRVVVGYSSGEVIALSLMSGEVLWAQNGSPLKNFGEAQKLPHIKALPIISGSNVYTISYNGQLSCFNFVTGDTVWTYPVGGTQTPVKVGNILFCISNTQQLVAFNSETGTLLWTQCLSRDEGVWNGPVAAGGLLYCLGKGRLIACDPGQKGAIVKIYPLSGTYTIPPIAVNGHIICLSKEGQLSIFSESKK
jgi:outer membrane protein assembly factor BamB